MDLQTPIFKSRKLCKTTKVRLAHSLLMTRLLHGAEAWPVLRAKQIGRIAKCYMHILRAATSEPYRPDKAKNFKLDADFLAEYNLLAVEYYVAQKRLLYAAQDERFR